MTFFSFKLNVPHRQGWAALLWDWQVGDTAAASLNANVHPKNH